jgi:hypothetical protein
MKFRLVIDHSAATTQPWYRVEKWYSPMGDRYPPDWNAIATGYEDKMRPLFERLKTGKEAVEVVTEFDTDAAVACTACGAPSKAECVCQRFEITSTDLEQAQ